MAVPTAIATFSLGDSASVKLLCWSVKGFRRALKDPLLRETEHCQSRETTY